MRARDFVRIALCTAIVSFGVVRTAAASPILVGSGAFNGTETLITFNSVGNEVAITNQFLGQGVTWSGSIFGMTNAPDTALFPANGGGVIAANWRYSLNGGGSPFSPIVATFSGLWSRVGFFAETNAADALLVTTFRNNVVTGSFTILNPNGLTVDFIGVEDLLGIDKIQIDAQNNTNRFVAIDDFKFGGSANGPVVPEPSTISLLVLGATAAVAHQRRRRRSTSA